MTAETEPVVLVQENPQSQEQLVLGEEAALMLVELAGKLAVAESDLHKSENLSHRLIQLSACVGGSSAIAAFYNLVALVELKGLNPEDFTNLKSFLENGSGRAQNLVIFSIFAMVLVLGAKTASIIKEKKIQADRVSSSS